MNLFDAFQFTSFIFQFSAQVIGESIPIDPTCNRWILFGSTFHAISAAWATLGYYAQADILYYIHNGFDKFAILLYAIAGGMGIFMMAFGQPPKNWVWFFISPALFYFMLDTPVLVHGVGWMVGPYIQDQQRVWKLAETGAVNSGVARRGIIRFDAENGPRPGTTPLSQPNGTVEVSQPFVLFDSLISDTVRQLSIWTGALSQVNPYQRTGGVDTERTNVALESNAPGHYFGNVIESDEQCGDGKVHYSAFTNSKWSYLNNITQAALTNSQARDAFARFIVNECGDHLTKAIDFSDFAKAANFEGSGLPDSVFFQDVTAGGAGVSRYYARLKGELARAVVPTPSSLKNLLVDELGNQPNANGSSFLRSVDWSPTGNSRQCGQRQPDPQLYAVNEILSRDQISCDAYLYVLLLYFRYEAGLIFSQSFQSGGEGGVDGWYPEDLTYNILYGWDIPFSDGGACSAKHRNGFSISSQYQFVYNLILAHLFRNELDRLPQLVKVGKDQTTTVIEDSELYNATIGSVSKAAEVYTWSLMIPYVQGILLYVLSLAFPLVCIIMLVPMWNKVIITWMSFFVWVKLWDLGFAMVSSLERSLWAMMANARSSRLINDRILEMSNYGGFDDVVCRQGNGLLPADICAQGNFGTNEPAIILTEGPGRCVGPEFGECLNVFATNVTPNAPGVSDSAFDASLRLFDLGLLVSSSLDLDLANGYYIYIMSALYFAIPAVTGQLVLGAKSGVAGMVDKIAADPAGKAASAADASFKGSEITRIKQTGASVSQESSAKGFRSAGLLHKALDQQNQAAMHGLHGSHMGQVEAGGRRMTDADALANNYAMKAREAMDVVFKGAYSQAGNSDQIERAAEQQRAQDRERESQQLRSATGLQQPGEGSNQTETAGSKGQGTDGRGTGAIGNDGELKTELEPVATPEPASTPVNTTRSSAATQTTMDEKGNRYSAPRGGPNTAAGQGTTSAIHADTKGAGDRAGNLRNYETFKENGFAKAFGLSNLGDAAGWAVDTTNNVANAAYGLERIGTTTARQNEHTARGGAAAIDGHYHHQMSSGIRSASERTMAQANFAAAMENYNTMADYAADRAGRFAVFGGSPGMLAPDKQPEDALGYAMAGMLDTPGRATRQAANFFDPMGGQFRSEVNKSRDNLHNQFGYAAVTQQYWNNRSTPEEAFTESFAAAGRMIGDLGLGNVRNTTSAHPADQRSGDELK
ncbi:hypothetical protein MRY87_10460 [bacterium]|nr:hypothetical protein [bacterium]